MKFDSIVYFIVLLLLLNAPFIFSHGYSHGYKGTADVCVSISDDNQSVNITHILVSYSNYLTPSNKSRIKDIWAKIRARFGIAWSYLITV